MGYRYGIAPYALLISLKLGIFDNILSLILVNQTNFGLVFAILTLASLPVIVFYLILSRQFTKGITAGALIG